MTATIMNRTPLVTMSNNVGPLGTNSLESHDVYISVNAPMSAGESHIVPKDIKLLRISPSKVAYPNP